MSVGREGVFPIPCSWTLPTVAVCTREENSHAFANGTRRGILLRVVSLNKALGQALEARARDSVSHYIRLTVVALR